MSTESFFPIGTPGQAWGAPQRAAWLAERTKLRSYADEVVTKIDALRARFDVVQYGELNYSGERYPLLAIKSRGWNDALPCALVTGGVHGYETSGVHGALQFVDQHAEAYVGRVNILVAPCVSPWAYERIDRWNADAIDVNRSFKDGGLCEEAAALMRLVAPLLGKFLMHVDLHETTDTDESQFRPALAARDGTPFEPGTIPDGFYLVDDTNNPQTAFQQAMIAAVEKITHIAPADEKGEIIGDKVVAHGVIHYPFKQLGLCAGMTGARFTTTTEVYPDSPRATAQQCNDAQAECVRAGLDFALNA